jgi:hypothetical protein
MAKAFRGTIVLLGIVLCFVGCQKVSTVAQPKGVRANSANVGADKSMSFDVLELPVASKVDGKYLKAFSIAYASFKDDALIPEDKRKLENYQIEFREQGDHCFVLFLAKRKPNERELLGGESELGKDVLYTIDCKTFALVDRKFFK